MTFLQTLGPNGTVIIVVSWKAGSREGPPGSLGVFILFRPLGRKGCPKGAFLKTMKIENGTKNKFFRIFRHWDPLKTLPGSGFEKTWKYMKNIWKSMFWWSKAINTYWKTSTFLDFLSFTKTIKKTKGTSQVMFWFPKWRHVLPRFDVSSDFWSFGAMPTKTLF